MKTTVLALGLVVVFAACSPSKTKENNAATEVAKTESKEVTTAISDYMSLKDALVQTDASSARIAAEKLVNSAMVENWNSEIITAVRTIASSEEVEVQRTAFKTVNDGLIEALKANKAEDGIYVQYCPMAFDNSGASWLSLSDHIKNPYFGDAMLTCGKVTEKL